MSRARPGREELKHLAETASPFNRLLGVRCDDVGEGRIVLHAPVRDEFIGDPRRPALHGGVLCALIDAAGGLAAWSVLDHDEAVSTIDLRVDFLEPAAAAGELRAEGRVVRKGGRTCSVRVELWQGDTLVAEGRGVWAIHRRRG